MLCCVAQVTRFLGALPSEGSARGHFNTKRTSKFSTCFCCILVFVKATEVALVFHLAAAGCLLTRSLVPPGGRGAAVNAVRSALLCFCFFLFFFNSLYAERVNESLPCIYLISQQSRDTVVTSVAGMLLYVSWQL